MNRQYFLWETVQRVRKGREYHCDCCCERICEGETYTRKLWVIGNHWHVMRQHSFPACDMPAPEYCEEKETLALSVRFTLRLEEKVVLRIDGTPEVIMVPRVVPSIEVSHEEDSGLDLDDDIPF